MKIQVDNKIIFELNEIQKKVIQNDIPSEIFREDMERRCRWVIEHKYEQCLERLKKEWIPKLSETMDSIPTHPDAFAEIVFNHPEYLSRSQREKKTREEEKKQRKHQ